MDLCYSRSCNRNIYYKKFILEFASFEILLSDMKLCAVGIGFGFGCLFGDMDSV